MRPRECTNGCRRDNTKCPGTLELIQCRLCERNLLRFGLIRRKAVEVYVEYGAALLNLQGVDHGARGEYRLFSETGDRSAGDALHTLPQCLSLLPGARTQKTDGKFFTACECAMFDFPDDLSRDLTRSCMFCTVSR
jgi:hypothetical protein